MGDLVVNRRAFHEYEILETFEAGIVLVGTEIKSLRNHGGSLQDAYVDCRGGELFLLQAGIAPYKFGNVHNHEEKRPRKLLFHKREIEKITKAITQKGLTAIALSIYLNKRGSAKIKIAIARGKKDYDKRAALKEKERKRSLQRSFEE